MLTSTVKLNRANNNKVIIIPKSSDIGAGDTVVIKKLNLNKVFED